MTKRLSFSTNAVRDLNDIWDESKKRWGIARAATYAEELIGRCRSALGGSVPSRKISFNGVTFLRVRSGSHFIFLVELPDKFQAVRILHRRQDAKWHLK